VQGAFINEKRIELEIRALTGTTARFMNQTDQWLAATHAINTAVIDSYQSYEGGVLAA
jgi:hypothetical protein